MHYGWIVLIVGFLAVFSSLGLARFGYTMILPSMQTGLGLSNTQAGALATGNFIGYLTLALIGGFLASRFSPRRVISISLLVVGITMLLTGAAGNFLTALLWRTITGMGSGGSNVPVMGLLAAWFASRRRGLATGVAVAGSSLGLIITGPLVPFILNAAGDNGWRLGWFVLGVIVLVISVISFLLLRDRPEDKGIVAIGEESPPLSPLPTQPHPPGQPKPAFLAWGDIYKSGAVWHLALIYTTFGFSYIIYVTFFAKYLQSEKGFSKEAAGNLWQIVGWISIFCGIIWGWVSDVLGRKYGLALVSFIQGTTYFIFAVSSSPYLFVLSAFLFGITAWSIPAIMAAACGDHLGSKLAPAALGFITLFFGIGQAFGPWIAGSIADSTSSFSLAFIVAMVAAYIGGFASLLLKRAH